MICTIRIPDVLQARIDSAAGDESRSKWILEACRMRLDVESSKRPEPEPVTGRKAQKDTSYGAGDASAASVTAKGDSQPRPTMDSLRAICAGKIEAKPPSGTPSDPTEVPICGKTWWEDGEQYECLMDAGHREGLSGKHGLRGMVQRLED